MQNALACPDLGSAERVFLMTVVLAATEYVNGQRRKGSQGMNERGHFALHYDYLARALHTSPGNAKKLAQRLAAKGHLSKRFPGTFGRPAGYQALDVRGDNTYRITLRDFVPPYAVQEAPLRGDMVSPLTYRTPDLGDQAPAACVTSTADQQVLGSDEEAEDPEDGGRVAGCEFHPWTRCEDDCRNADTTDNRRRTA